jgi:hypothetical protein
VHVSSKCQYRHALLMAGVVIVPRRRHFHPGSTMTDGQWALLARGQAREVGPAPGP